MPNASHNLVLDVSKILETIQSLEQRIQDRFPDSSLRKKCNDLFKIAKQTQENIDRIGQPNLPIRAFALAIIVTVITLIIYSLTLVDFSFTL